MSMVPVPDKYLSGNEGDQAEDDFDYVKELEIMGNAFASNNPNAKEMEHTTASIDPNILVAASDPIAMYAAATIIARGSEVVDESPATSMEAPSFNARGRAAANTPCNIHELDSELKELFGYISSKNIDVTSLQEHVGNYIEHARTFHASDPSDKAESSLPSLEEQFLKRGISLGKEEERIELQHAEILKVDQRCDELQKELKLLKQKKSELSSTLANYKDSFAKHDETVKGLTILHTSLEKDIVTAKESAARHKEAEENFQNARALLESLQWEP
ncbi:Spindle pole component BBP1 [Bienertia sinuspersici]